MGSALQFSTKIGGAVRAMHDDGKAVIAVSLLVFAVFVAGVGGAFGIGWGFAAFFASLSGSPDGDVGHAAVFVAGRS
jgi:hypothetical protein